MNAPRSSPWGVMAEFATADALLAAAQRLRAAGYTRLEAYAPFHVEGLADALGFRRTRLPLITLLGALAGGVGAWLMQWYSAVIDYPYDIGGRPFHSWPAFIPITFEMTVLCAAGAAVLGMLGLNGLPRPHHPVFSVPGFELASRNRFFLLVLHYDPIFDADKAITTLHATRALSVQEVPHP